MWICMIFCSPRLKAQVSFCDHIMSVVRPSDCLPVNISFFQDLLENHWTNINQTCTLRQMKFKVVEIKDHALFQGNIIMIYLIFWEFFKNHLQGWGQFLWNVIKYFKIHWYCYQLPAITIAWIFSYVINYFELLWQMYISITLVLF